MKTQPEQREDEWNELSRIATKYLDGPHTVPAAESLNRWRYRLRLWHYPSFTENRSWGIYQRQEPGSRLLRTLVRQLTWDRTADSERLWKPLVGLEKGFHSQPTIELRDRPIESVEFEVRLRVLQVISFPAFAGQGIGIDGESYGIELPGRETTVEWWCGGPDSWREVTAWAAETRDWLTGITALPPRSELWEFAPPRLP